MFSTCVGGCWVAKPRSNLRMKGRAGLERNFFQTSASRLMREWREQEENGFINQAQIFYYTNGINRLWAHVWEM